VTARSIGGIALLLAVLCADATATAQAPTAYLSRGISSYQTLEYDSAAGWLRRALTPPLIEGLRPADQVRALVYLGATERFRRRNEAAINAFRRMLRLDPSARPDPLVFPPEVTQLFDMVRADFPIVAIEVPDVVTLQRGGDPYPILLRASTPHRVTLLLERADGRVTDTVFAGPVGDTLALTWTGLDRDGISYNAGRYWLTATSVEQGPRSCRVRLPVDLTAPALDTIPHPAPLTRVQLLPERAGAGDAPRGLARTVVIGAAAFALPSIARDAESRRSHLLVGALGVTGITALIRLQEGKTLPENIATNAVIRARWEREVDQVKRVNQERRGASMLRVQAGEASPVGCVAG
jgi:hypothetical protein